MQLGPALHLHAARYPLSCPHYPQAQRALCREATAGSHVSEQCANMPQRPRQRQYGLSALALSETDQVNPCPLVGCKCTATCRWQLLGWAYVYIGTARTTALSQVHTLASPPLISRTERPPHTSERVGYLMSPALPRSTERAQHRAMGLYAPTQPHCCTPAASG